MIAIREQQRFVEARQNDWRELEALVHRDMRARRWPPEDLSRLAELYRALCSDLMRAKAAGYQADLVTSLERLAVSTHNRFYGVVPFSHGAIRTFVREKFPRVVRANARFVWLSTLLFAVPLVLAFALAILDPAQARSLVPAEMLEAAIDNYSDAIEGRAESADTMMAAFYVHNNIGIAFRCFATGIFFGLGSVFFLFYNGLVIGLTLGAVTAAGYGHNIFTFVCGHGAFELTAIVISGAAGLRMGWALVQTGGRTRIGSLRAAGGELVTLAMGAGLMLLVAAFIEAFWSPSGVAAPVKHGTAAVLWIGVIVYLCVAGRRSGAPRRKRGA